MSIRVFLADHHKILRDGLRSLFANQTGIEVVGESAGGESTLAGIRKLRPDVVILEGAMPGLEGPEIMRRMRAEVPEAGVVVLSSQYDRHTVIDMLRAGANAFLAKESGFEEVMQAVQAVNGGHPYLGVMATGSLIDELQGHTALTGRMPAELVRERTRALTSREIEVLQLLATGKRVKEIARLLGISIKTVESHRQNMMDKLEIHSAIELTRYALREGLASV